MRGRGGATAAAGLCGHVHVIGPSAGKAWMHVFGSSAHSFLYFPSPYGSATCFLVPVRLVEGIISPSLMGLFMGSFPVTFP